MLNNIPRIISPDLLKYLSEMGHGDELILVDANYPSYTCGVQHVVRADGTGAEEMLDAILSIFPVDTFVKTPVTCMQVVPGDNYTPVIFDSFKKVLKKHGVDESNMVWVERFHFYELASKAYCLVATGELQRYANIILKKGLVEQEK